MHGLQLWVALPEGREDVEPSFSHHPAATLPELEDGGVRARVLAGSAYGATSPVVVASPLFYVEAQLAAGARIEIPREHEERGVYVVSVRCDAAERRSRRARWRSIAVARPR